MKIDFSTKIMNPDGTEVRLPAQDEHGRPVDGPILTIGLIARTCFHATADDKVSNEDRYRRGKLGDEVWEATHKAGKGPAVLDLSIENVALLKELVAKHYTPMIVHRVWNILENADKKVQ